jgi:hypothetical protein
MIARRGNVAVVSKTGIASAVPARLPLIPPHSVASSSTETSSRHYHQELRIPFISGPMMGVTSVLQVPDTFVTRK